VIIAGIGRFGECHLRNDSALRADGKMAEKK
jgi:hypothetical protein